MKHTCAAPNCTRSISTELLLCPAHYALVPNNLQHNLRNTWSTFLRRPNLKTHTRYRAARQALLNAASGPVSQTSKSAVSQVSKPASCNP